MNPETQFCHNLDCPARGQVGQGSITIHSRKQARYRCRVCGKTFAATKGTPFFGLKVALDIVTLVLILLSHGCPTQAIVAAFGLDERTVADWLERTGKHAQHVHQHLLAKQPLELGHVQADELWVKMVGRKVWQAMAIAVPSRMWLGGVISECRDRHLIDGLTKQVRAASVRGALLVCVDGLASYVGSFKRAFRRRVQQARGRPRLEQEPDLLIGQVIKRRKLGRLEAVEQRIVQGSEAAVNEVLVNTHSGTTINTSYIERVNATFRSKLAFLVRRTRTLARRQAALEAGMWLVGVSYNLCWYHTSLRVSGTATSKSRWLERTPAMAAGLTDHCWSLRELMSYQVPPPPFVAPKRRGRPPKCRSGSAPSATTV